MKVFKLTIISIVTLCIQMVLLKPQALNSQINSINLGYSVNYSKTRLGVMEVLASRFNNDFDVVEKTKLFEQKGSRHNVKNYMNWHRFGQGWNISKSYFTSKYFAEIYYDRNSFTSKGVRMNNANNEEQSLSIKAKYAFIGFNFGVMQFKKLSLLPIIGTGFGAFTLSTKYKSSSLSFKLNNRNWAANLNVGFVKKIKIKDRYVYLKVINFIALTSEVEKGLADSYLFKHNTIQTSLQIPIISKNKNKK